MNNSKWLFLFKNRLVEHKFALYSLVSFYIFFQNIEVHLRILLAEFFLLFNLLGNFRC